jgi:hypothetical protein
MSQANLPNITPNISITREDAINLILSSVAMEELGLSHILNAEGEKLQYVLGTLPGLTGPPATIQNLLDVNESVLNTLDSATRSQMFLQSKMQKALNSSVMVGATGPIGPIGPTGPAGGPVGPTGATGPIGATGVFSPAYASFWSGSMVIAPSTVIPLNSSNGVNSPGYTVSSGEITIPEAGVFLISISYSVGPGDEAFIVLRRNGADVLGAAIGSSTRSGADSQTGISRTVLVRLNAGETLDLFRRSGTANATLIAFADNVNSSCAIQITIVKLS